VVGPPCRRRTVTHHCTCFHEVIDICGLPCRRVGPACLPASAVWAEGRTTASRLSIPSRGPAVNFVAAGRRRTEESGAGPFLGQLARASEKGARVSDADDTLDRRNRLVAKVGSEYLSIADDGSPMARSASGIGVLRETWSRCYETRLSPPGPSGSILCLEDALFFCIIGIRAH